jgi:hypothetical protein
MPPHVMLQGKEEDSYQKEKRKKKGKEADRLR